MNHFMLPQAAVPATGAAHGSKSTRFGNFAMEKLINELIEGRLLARIRWRSRCSAAATSPTPAIAIGTDNSEFVLRYLEAEGTALRGAGSAAVSCRAAFTTSPATGKVVRRLLGAQRDRQPSLREETEYVKLSVAAFDRRRNRTLRAIARNVNMTRRVQGSHRRRFGADAAVAVDATVGRSRRSRWSALPATRMIARDRIKALNPDVVTLDVEMPHMDGVTFLRKIMTLRPMPVIMISTLTQAGAETTLEALEIGAVDFIAKPTTDVARRLADNSPASCRRRSSRPRACASAERPRRVPATAKRGAAQSAGRHAANGSSRSAHQPAASRR